LALKCLAAEPKLRPSMKEVLEKLEWFEAANERPREPRNHASHPMQPLHHRSPLYPRLDGNPAYQNSSRVRPKSNNSSKSNRTPPKFSHFVLSFFFAAKPLTNSSKRPSLTIRI
ncbi:putative serine/threonine-protein kinase pix13, partial [Quercus suber]